MPDREGCRLVIRATTPDGEQVELPLSDAIEEAEAEDAEDDISEVWNEVARDTTEITIEGVVIERIVRVTFQKPSGKNVQLVFEEAGGP